MFSLLELRAVVRRSVDDELLFGKSVEFRYIVVLYTYLSTFQGFNLNLSSGGKMTSKILGGGGRGQWYSVLQHTI